jgi:hypothetical protein
MRPTFYKLREFLQTQREPRAAQEPLDLQRRGILSHPSPFLCQHQDTAAVMRKWVESLALLESTSGH